MSKSLRPSHLENLSAASLGVIWSTLQLILTGVALLVGFAVFVPADLVNSTTNTDTQRAVEFANLNSVRNLFLTADQKHVWVLRYPSIVEQVELDTGKVIMSRTIGARFNGGVQLSGAMGETALYHTGGFIFRQPLHTDEPPNKLLPSQCDWIAASPMNDLLAVCTEAVVEIWSVTTGTRLKTLELDCMVSRLSWSPDGRRLLLKLSDGQLQIRDGETLALECSQQTSTRGEGFATWGRNGNHVALFAPIGLVPVWDLKHDHVVSLPIEPAYFHAAALHPDGTSFAIPGHDGQIWLLAVDGTSPRRALETGASLVNALCFTPDGASVLVGGSDGRVECWSIADGTLRWSLDGSPASKSPSTQRTRPSENLRRRTSTPQSLWSQRFQRGRSWASTRS